MVEQLWKDAEFNDEEFVCKILMINCPLASFFLLLFFCLQDHCCLYYHNFWTARHCQIWGASHLTVKTEKFTENALPVLRHKVCTFSKVEKCMGTFKTQSCLALFTRDEWYSILPLRPYGGSIQSVSLASLYPQDFC